MRDFPVLSELLEPAGEDPTGNGLYFRCRVCGQRWAQGEQSTYDGDVTFTVQVSPSARS